MEGNRVVRIVNLGDGLGMEVGDDESCAAMPPLLLNHAELQVPALGALLAQAWKASVRSPDVDQNKI